MCRIVLDTAPSFWDDCPFMRDKNKCFLNNMGKCDCFGGYYDEISFDFSRCPYCTTND